MNSSHSNGINPALLASYHQNSQSQQHQQQQQQQFSLPQQYGHQQQQHQQSSPQYPQGNKFQYNNGAQYPAMYQGGGNQSVNPAQAMQGAAQGVNPAQLMNNGRNNMTPMIPSQMAAAAQVHKSNMSGGGANGVNPAVFIGGGSNPQAAAMISSAQMAQLANMTPQDRQKTMLYFRQQQQQQQQRRFQQHQTQSMNLQQQQQQQYHHQQQQQQQQQQPLFDRPPSAMSGQQLGMMPPPSSVPPRPPTSMSRPGTSHSHNSPHQPGPPSRPTTAQSHPGHQASYPMSGTPNPGLQQHPPQQDNTETPGSPYRGSKRKLSSTGVPPIQTPRMGNQALSMGLQNMSAGGMDNLSPTGVSQQQFIGGFMDPRGGGPGMMGGAGGGLMGPPVVPRSNQQPSQVQQQLPVQNLIQQQMFDPSAGGFGGGDSSPSNMNSFMNGLHQAQMGGVDGMMSGPPGGSSTSGGLTPAMLAQLQPQQPHHGTRSTVRSMSSSGTTAPPAVSTNFGQIMTDPSRMSALSANAMASLIGGGGGTAGAVGTISKMTTGMGSAASTPRPGQLGASNSIPSYSNATSSSSTIPVASGQSASSGSATSSKARHSSLPSSAALNPKVTQVSAISLAASLKEIPPLRDAEIEDVKGWMQSDQEYEERYKAMRERMDEEVNVIVRKGEWWERDDTAATISRNRRDKFGVGLSGARIARRKMGSRAGIKLPRKISAEDANRPELLVPVRLELDIEHHKMRDTFVWNLNDPVISPEMFAQSIVEDYNLPSSSQIAITKAIQEQLSDFKAHTPDATGDDGDDAGRVEPHKGELDDNDTVWWEGWRKRLRNENGFVRRKRRKLGFDLSNALSNEDRRIPPPSQDDLDFDERSSDEMRILVKLDIIVGSIKLEDQFEWDLTNEDGGAPEQFAEVYSKELGLSGEFKTAIAHSIREQVQIYQKSLFLVGHPSDGVLVPDEDLRTSFLPSLTNGVARSLDQVPAFTPLLNYLSDGELERNEKEREKELNRRRRKTTRGRRGVALPDREPLKTCRTPAIGFSEVESSALINAAIAPPTTKRAAAAAASLTIANMVASENGTALMQPSTPMSMPATIPAQQHKDKKPRGLYKAPPYPSSVLRPRARVTAPTPSTGLDSSRPPVSMDGAVTVAPESSRGGTRVLSAKKARELEKEAREKEYVDGQHPNWIDGVWHCSNCGCPESIAIGRRKGPLGDKSQCGTCGKYWHRHRRPRPVEYSSDLKFHQNQQMEAEQTKVAVTKKKKPVSNVADNSDRSVQVEDIDDIEPGDTSQGLKEEEEEGFGRTDSFMEPLSEDSFSIAGTQPARQVDDERGGSPASSSSSGSESPLAKKVKMNGNNSFVPAPPPISSRETPTVDDPDHQHHPAPAPVSTDARPLNLTRSLTPAAAPEWLKDATTTLQDRYPQDKFEVTLRRVNPGVTPQSPGWRIKCIDCPGKLYTAGPNNTLQNFEVHLRNRQHRQKVSNRVNGVALTST